MLDWFIALPREDKTLVAVLYAVSFVLHIVIGLALISEKRYIAEVRWGARILLIAPTGLGVLGLLGILFWTGCKAIVYLIRLALPSSDEKMWLLRLWSRKIDPPQNPATHL